MSEIRETGFVEFDDDFGCTLLSMILIIHVNIIKLSDAAP